jgi:hypothetical protein
MQHMGDRAQGSSKFKGVDVDQLVGYEHSPYYKLIKALFRLPQAIVIGLSVCSCVRFINSVVAFVQRYSLSRSMLKGAKTDAAHGL